MNKKIVMSKALAKKTDRLIHGINTMTRSAMKKSPHNGVASVIAMLVIEKAVWSSARLHDRASPKLHKLACKLHAEAESAILKAKSTEEARSVIDLMVEKAVYAAIA